MDDKSVFGLLGLLYDGLLYPDRWNEFLAELSNRLGAHAGSISFHDAENRAHSKRYSVGLSREAGGECTGYYGSRNPITPEVLRAVFQIGLWYKALPLYENTPSERNSEYGQWLRRHDVYQQMVMAVGCGPAVAALSFARPPSGKPFAEGEENLMRYLALHLQRVFQVHDRTETLGCLIEAGKLALDSLDTGVVAVDEEGRVVLMNEQAERLLQKGQGITIRGAQHA